MKINNIIIHKTGNDSMMLSKHELSLSENVKDLLTHYFTSAFKEEIYYSFYHETDLSLNEVYRYISDLFEEETLFIEQSKKLAKHLHNNSSHPKIKDGELYVVTFEDCLINGENVNAIGLFKSENKYTFLKVFPENENINLEAQQGVNINKLDKGCIVYNSEKNQGYIVSVIDNTNKGSEAQYWFDDFLNVRQRKDEYYNTQNALSLCKNYVTSKLPTEFEGITKADQTEILNNSIKYFKENDNFDLEDFANEVIQLPEVIDSFNEYRKTYEQNREIEISDSFVISDSAVKKQARSFKSVIKLDKNFHIYVHGNNQYLKKGFDEATGMHYYQLFFNEEL